MRESVVTRHSFPGVFATDKVARIRPDIVALKGPRVMMNAATLREIREWQFGACPGNPSAAERPVNGATRYAEPRAAESGLARCSSRLTRSRLRVPLLARGYPCPCSDPAWTLCRAFLSRLGGRLVCRGPRRSPGPDGRVVRRRRVCTGLPPAGAVSTARADLVSSGGKPSEPCGDDAGWPTTGLPRPFSRVAIRFRAPIPRGCRTGRSFRSSPLPWLWRASSITGTWRACFRR